MDELQKHSQAIISTEDSWRSVLSKQLTGRFIAKYRDSLRVNKCFIIWSCVASHGGSCNSTTNSSKITGWPPPTPMSSVDDTPKDLAMHDLQHFPCHQSGEAVGLVNRSMDSFHLLPSVGTWRIAWAKPIRTGVSRPGLQSVMDQHLSAQLQVMAMRQISGVLTDNWWVKDFRSDADWDELKSVCVKQCCFFQCRMTVMEAWPQN